MTTLALRRILVRRRRPPSGRTILATLYLLLALNEVAFITAWLLPRVNVPNTVLWVFTIALWWYNYRTWRKILRRTRKTEEALGHIPQVQPMEWALISGLWVFAVAQWIFLP